MMDRASFAAHLRKLRTERGLTQAVCARAAGVHTSTWQEWESGALPHATRAPEIARALGIPILALLEQPNGRVPIADLYVSDETIARIRSQGAPELERAVEAALKHVRRAITQAAQPPPAPRAPERRRARPVASQVRRRLASTRWPRA